MDEYIGMIKYFAGNYAPKNWIFANGSILAINTNQALFSLLGTTYGGNGVTTFAVPDLRGRVAIGYNIGAPGPGLSSYGLGQPGGTESVTLTQQSIPPHTHSLNANNTNANTVSPASNNYLSVIQVPSGRDVVSATQYTSNAVNTVLSPTSIGIAGGSQPHENRQPYLALSAIICIYGLYPSRP